jgi:DNA topoisomerase II
VLSLFLYY